MQKLTIDVTKEHIFLGEPLDAEFCPVAWALKDKFPNRQIVAGDDFIHIGGPNGDNKIPTPKEARQFINSFDNYEPEEGDEVAVIAPFVFELELPEDFA